MADSIKQAISNNVYHQHALQTHYATFKPKYWFYSMVHLLRPCTLCGQVCVVPAYYDFLVDDYPMCDGCCIDLHEEE